MSVCKVPVISRQKAIDCITNMMYINRHNMTKSYRNLKSDICGSLLFIPKNRDMSINIYFFMLILSKNVKK